MCERADLILPVDVALMYLSFGTKKSRQFTWLKITKKVSIGKGGV